MSECKTAVKYPFCSNAWKLVRVKGDAIFGGNAKASTGRLNAVYKSHTIGTRTQIAPTPSTIRTIRRCSHEGCNDRGSWDAFIVLAPPAENENQRNGNNHYDYHCYRQSGTIADLTVLKSRQIRVVVQYCRACAWAPSGHQVHQGELAERIYHSEYDSDDQDRLYTREGDVPEDL